MQHFQTFLQKITLVRWLLFLWICLIYLWGIQPNGPMNERFNPQDLLPFTLLMLLHAGMYGLSVILPPSFYRSRLLYFAIQALLILLIGLVSPRISVTMSLYLSLLGEIASMVLKIRQALLAIGACLLLISLNIKLLYSWDASFVSHHIVLYVMPVSLLVVGYALLFTRQARAYAQTQSLLHELERAHRQLEDDAVRIEALSRAAERQRMARELHDTLAQGLAGLILQLEAVKAHLGSQSYERALQIVTQAMARARTALGAARCAIDDLRGERMTPAGLQQAISDEVERFTTATGIPCTTQLASLSTNLDTCGEDIVKIVAEGLLNVARHAQAGHVWVSLTAGATGLALEVRDNGVGFDSTLVAQPGHYGLLGLRERARLRGGKFALLTRPGQGTTIRLLLPAAIGEGAS